MKHLFQEYVEGQLSLGDFFYKALERLKQRDYLTLKKKTFRINVISSSETPSNLLQENLVDLGVSYPTS